MIFLYTDETLYEPVAIRKKGNYHNSFHYDENINSPNFPPFIENSSLLFVSLIPVKVILITASSTSAQSAVSIITIHGGSSLPV